jgi:hypothetical protein
VVFGPAIRPPHGTTDGWWRGTRGWGSAAIILWNCTGGNLAPYNFQQNPCDQIEPVGTQVEIEEAAADMFLNWVYYAIGETSFQNTLWNESINGINCFPPGCSDNGLLTGDVRRDWMRVVQYLTSL